MSWNCSTEAMATVFMWSWTVPLHSGVPKAIRPVFPCWIRTAAASPRIIPISSFAVALLVISKQFKVPLASDWKLDFDMSEETGSGFYNPYFLTKGQKLKGNIARFAFLGPISGALQADTDGVSYSIPLTAEDGTVIGVLGGTMLKEQIYSLLKNELLHKDEDTILMLAKRGENETVLTPVLTYGMSFHRSF